MISLIVPTLNEERQISSTLGAVREADEDRLVGEVLVADGGSQDQTGTLARKAGARVVSCPRPGRAAQMNYAAAQAAHPILYFLHSDSRPPQAFSALIRNAVQGGYCSGCFRLAFDHPHRFLQTLAWCTRFDLNVLRYGDQSLFVRRDIFLRSGGFKETLTVMEDQEMVTRLRRHGRFLLMPQVVTTSARRYLQNGMYRTQLVFVLIAWLHWMGCPQRHLVALYRRLLRDSYA